jgi:hypothetical protein
MVRDLHAEIRQAAAEFDALNRQIHVTVLERDTSPEERRAWADACDAFHKYRSILDTFWYPESLQRLLAGDPELLEIAIAFVEVDPYYFRSGYMKQRLFRRLKRLTLPEPQRQRIRQAVISALRLHRGSGWKDFCILDTAFADDNFANSVAIFASDASPQVAWRARTLLDHLKSGGFK